MYWTPLSTHSTDSLFVLDTIQQTNYDQFAYALDTRQQTKYDQVLAYWIPFNKQFRSVCVSIVHHLTEKIWSVSRAWQFSQVLGTTQQTKCDQFVHVLDTIQKTNYSQFAQALDIIFLSNHIAFLRSGTTKLNSRFPVIEEQRSIVLPLRR